MFTLPRSLVLLAAAVMTPTVVHPAIAETTAPLAALVDPLIGTDASPVGKAGWAFGTGNVFPGAVCPRGIVAWSPDTTHCDKIAGGYWYPDDKIDDFSLTHFSGRGVITLMNVGFIPLIQKVESSPGTHWTDYASTFSHKNEVAAAGYYKVKFDNGIQTELSATPRTGIAHFTFPTGSDATMLLRANGKISVSGNTASGYAEAKLTGRPYKTYFIAQFTTAPKTVKTWVGDKLNDAADAQDPSCGAILSFDTADVGVRVGISYTSVENAADNLKQESGDTDFDSIKSKAAELWNTELNRIQVEGGTKDAQVVFYTAMYHCFMHPNYLEDANGQYLGMDAKVHSVEPGHHQYQNIPAWDEHRSHTPLMAMIEPKEYSDVLQSLVNYAKQDESVAKNGGGLPRWQQVNLNTGGMLGDGDDSIISTAYAFGVTQFDTKGALAAMNKGASIPGTTSNKAIVRGNLKEYMSLGYVPENASYTLEYCSDDFALAQFAKSLGDEAKYSDYLKRSQNWKLLFDASTGYLRPKAADGTFAAAFKPSDTKGFTEGTAAQYVWMVNFNLQSLIKDLGGNEKVVDRLDHFFTKTNAGYQSDYAYMGNEPCEEVPWVYDFASAPWRTQDVVRRIQQELFTSKPNGFPGNDDAGSISSWYIFSALGIYPEIPGVAGFVVGSPVFNKATIHLADGKSLQINGANASEANRYVQTLKINGKAYESPWIPWSTISDGGSIDFELGDSPSRWGSDPKLAPPSYDLNQ